MKDILILLFVLFFPMIANAQDKPSFSFREVNHIRVATPGLFAKGNHIYLHLDSLKEHEYAFPLPGGKVISAYGTRGGHSGADIKTCANDTIRAAFSGKVRMVKYERRGYGKYVVIRHENGLETVYGHLSKQIVNEDQYVEAGEPIGLGGNTGRSTGSHLHFETRFLGQAINPALLFDFEKQDIVADSYLFRKGNNRYRRNNTSSKNVSLMASSDGTIRYHKVRSGDTLSRIAQKTGTSIDALCKLNHITRRTILRPGQVLRCS